MLTGRSSIPGLGVGMGEGGILLAGITIGLVLGHVPGLDITISVRMVDIFFYLTYFYSHLHCDIP